MKENIQKALECQLNREFASAYLYLSFSSWFSDQSLDGFANWMRIQAEEEMAHAMNIYDYLIEASEKVQFPAIAGATSNITSPLHAFEMTHAHEQSISDSINSIVDLAFQEKDYATYEYMMWYVREQVEEESTVRHYVDRLKLIGSDGPSLLQLDTELAARTFVDPFANATN